MTTYNFSNGSLAGVNPGDKAHHNTTPRGFAPFILRNVFDTAGQNIANDASIAQVLNIPAGVTVLACWLNTLTVDPTGGTVSLGVTGVDATRWGSAIALTPVGFLAGTGGPPFLPLYFGSDDTIDILEDGAQIIDTWKAEIIAVCVQTNDSVDAGGEAVA
jgi:hypothetical protein